MKFENLLPILTKRSMVNVQIPSPFTIYIYIYRYRTPNNVQCTQKLTESILIST